MNAGEMWLTVLPNILGAGLVTGLAVAVTVRRPPQALWPLLPLYQLFIFLYIVGDAITLVSQSPFVEQVGIAILYSGSLPGAATCFILALRYAEVQGLPFEFANRRWFSVPVIAAAVGWGVMITNPLHGQFVTPVLGDHNVHHWLWWAIVPGGYLAVLASLLLYLALARRASTVAVRRNALLMSGALLVTFALNCVSYVQPASLPFDLTVVGLGVASAITLFGAYRTRLFSLLPIAIEEVIRHDPDGLILVDLDGGCLRSNPTAEKILGVDFERPGMDVVSLMARRFREPDGEPLRRDDLFRRLLRAPRATHEVVGPLAAGDGHFLQVSATPIPRLEGRAQAVSIRLQDVSEQTLMQGELRRARADLEARVAERTAELARVVEQLSTEAGARRAAEQERRALELRVQDAQRRESLETLARGVAHDFNNVLGVMLGNARLAGLEGESEASRERYLRRVRIAGEHGARLTEQLSTYAGRSAPIFDVLDVRVLIDETRELLGACVGPNHVLHIDLGSNAAEGVVLADATQIRQILVNLVTNAGEALGDEPGDVTLRVSNESCDGDELDEARVVLEVEDSGPGMDEATRQRVFEPFYSTKHQGRGQGLAAVSGIVAAHGGQITVASQPGEGACFRVLLPVAVADAARVEVPATPSPIPVEGGLVLVVDDDEAGLELAGELLRRAGYDTLLAANGEQAITVFAERAEEVRGVVLDLHLPDMDGEQVLAALRTCVPRLPAVVLTGLQRDGVSERLGQSGDLQVLTKPYQLEELEEFVGRMQPVLD